MTDTEADVRDRMKECEEQQDYERGKRKTIQREVTEHAHLLEANEKALQALAHTTGKLIDAVMKDESLWQHTVVVVKKNTKNA